MQSKPACLPLSTSHSAGVDMYFLPATALMDAGTGDEAESQSVASSANAWSTSSAIWLMETIASALFEAATYFRTPTYASTPSTATISKTTPSTARRTINQRGIPLAGAV